MAPTHTRLSRLYAEPLVTWPVLSGEITVVVITELFSQPVSCEKLYEGHTRFENVPRR